MKNIGFGLHYDDVFYYLSIYYVVSRISALVSVQEV